MKGQRLIIARKSTLFNNVKDKNDELEKSATVKDSLTVQMEGQRKVNRKMENYNLDVFIPQSPSASVQPHP